MSNQPSWGIVGLGVMGTSLGRNLADKGVALAIYNREVEGTEEA
jgi:6-phosphogluconate dehydrogenase